MIGRAGSSPPLPCADVPLRNYTLTHPFPSFSLSIPLSFLTPPLPFPSLTPFPVRTVPYPLELGPYIVARRSGGALKLPQCSGQSPAAKRYLVHFRAENASGDNHCLDEFLGENHLFHTSLVEILPSEDLDEIWCQYTRTMGL